LYSNKLSSPWILVQALGLLCCTLPILLRSLQCYGTLNRSNCNGPSFCVEGTRANGTVLSYWRVNSIGQPSQDVLLETGVNGIRFGFTMLIMCAGASVFMIEIVGVKAPGEIGIRFKRY